MRRTTLALTLGFFLCAVPAHSQMTEVSIDSRTDEAMLIVEARVLESTPFWSPDRTQILTDHRLDVLKVLKLSGMRLDEVEEVHVLTLGGQVDDVRSVVTPSLSLRPGENGLFFLEQRKAFAGLSDVWLPASGPQGFVRYNPVTGEAHDPFRTYTNLQDDLFEPIRARTGQPMTVVQQHDPDPLPLLGGPTITGFNPTTISGGVQEILTIDGSGFGTFTGAAAVFFDDPDDGPGGLSTAVNALHVVSWNDTQIQVYVPAGAGSGSVVVQDSAALGAVSPSTLTVDYSLGEWVSAELERFFHEYEDGRGGYTLVYSTNTADNGVDFTSIADAVNRFDDALEDWRCATGWAVEADGTTTVNSTGNDGVNMVGFDNDADPLPGGVLGRATSWYQGCSSLPTFPEQWNLTDINIRFKRDGTGVNWYYGADTAGQMGSEQDFQSVAAHEIGHAVQHKHVNNAGDMMFFSIATGTNNRTLSAANIAGGQDIMAYSNGRVSVCAVGMRTFDCSNAPTAQFQASPLGTCGTTLDVDFTDLSFDGPTTWNWSFGDTNTSTVRNPSHTYNGRGIHSVTLDASNVNGSDSATADDLIVLTTDPTATCAPTFTGYISGFNVGPVRVTLNTIDHVTQTNTEGDPMYEDFTCSQITVLEPEMSYPISVYNGGPNDEVVRVYIDWDNDGTLAAGELVLDSFLGAQVHNGTVNVPASPVINTALRMRVLSDFFTNPIASGCENIEAGQVEDYSVVVSKAIPPGKIPDTSLRIRKSAVVGAIVLSWDPSTCPGGSDYSIYQGNLGDWDSHTQKICSTGGNLIQALGHGNPSRYYLVVPFSTTGEGSYGLGMNDVERGVGVSPCTPEQDTSLCPP